MLTLGTDQIERQKRTNRLREQEHRSRETLMDQIEKKTFTVARDGDIVTTNLEQQIGQPLSSPEFIRRLQAMNQDFVVDPTLTDPTKMGIYVVRPQKQDDGSLRTEKVFICGLTRGFMPERSVRHMKRERMPNPDPHNKGTFIDVDVFTKETRGWRTVLAKLLRFRLITEAQIAKHFPPNLNSRNWKLLTT